MVAPVHPPSLMIPFTDHKHMRSKYFTHFSDPSRPFFLMTFDIRRVTRTASLLSLFLDYDHERKIEADVGIPHKS